jgi:hypothetical protein
MRKVLAFAAILALAGGVAYANYCARDNVPAATLLFPYITVDTDAAGVPDPNGQTTITGITNVSRNAIIVHFTAWDILSVPQVDFDEILSGYDVLQINWRDFLNGRFDAFDTSRTAFTLPGGVTPASSATFDPFEWGPDGRGQGGGLTTPENRNVITTTACPNVPPYLNRSDLAPTIRGLLTNALHAYPHNGCSTGVADLRGDKMPAYGTNLTANPIFFYVTADVVSSCNLSFPNSLNYFTTYANLQKNVMIGDMVWLKPGAVNYSEAMPAVAIESGNVFSGNGGSTIPPTYHFYQERANPANTTFREPLGTAFAFRYSNVSGGATSNLIFWKNLHEATISGPKIDDCGSYLYYAWDMDEHVTQRGQQCPVSPCSSATIDPNEFPFEINVVPLTNANFDLPATYGWMLIVLPPSYGTVGVDYSDPTPNIPLLTFKYYGWAGVRIEYAGFSAGLEAATMANAHCFETQMLPFLGINYNYGDGNHAPAWW